MARLGSSQEISHRWAQLLGLVEIQSYLYFAAIHTATAGSSADGAGFGFPISVEWPQVPSKVSSSVFHILALSFLPILASGVGDVGTTKYPYNSSHLLHADFGPFGSHKNLQ